METLSRIGTALTAGCGATLCVHPLDVVRVNLQVDSTGVGKRAYNGTFDCIKKIAARDGAKGLVRLVVPRRATCMAAFQARSLTCVHTASHIPHRTSHIAPPTPYISSSHPSRPALHPNPHHTLSQYAGLSAGILRQMTYGGPRMAIYPMLMDMAKDKSKPDAPLPLYKKFMCGASAGGLASLTGVPSEVRSRAPRGTQKP